jgi:shikimate dehydrogenase
MNDLYGVLGYPLGHSLSPEWMEAAFGRGESPRPSRASSYILMEYREYPGLEALARQFPTLRGLNVTLPYKQAVFDEMVAKGWPLSEPARLAGALNCLRLERDPKGNLVRVHGHNTDVVGFRKSLESWRQEGLEGPALVLGNGGAALAVGVVLKELALPYLVVGRSAPADLSWDLVQDALVEASPLLVQCTPLGMWPEEAVMPPLPLEGIGHRHRVVDLIYRPSTTRFLEACRNKGAQIMGGMVMFEAQARASLEFWSNP